MKRKFLIGALILLFPNVVLAAPDVSMKVSANSIKKGESATVTVTSSDTAAWNIKIAGSGAATCSTKQADVTSDGKSTTKNFDLSCDSVSEGTITFLATGDVTSGDGETRDISLSEEVLVIPLKAETNNGIKTLKIRNYNLNFDSNTTNYNLTIGNEEKLELEVVLEDSNSEYKIIGNEKLKNGSIIKIIVTSQSGSTKEYTLNIKKVKEETVENPNTGTFLNIGYVVLTGAGIITIYKMTRKKLFFKIR